METTTIDFDTVKPRWDKIGLLFDRPEMRPPVLEEMKPDLDRLIASVATTYVDQSCQALHFDELVSEGNAKLATVISKGYLDKAPTRSKFFGLFKMAYTNHVKSLVQRHRFTQKRTGVKPPPRGAEFTGHEAPKNLEISLDDPEVGLQLPDLACAQPCEDDIATEYKVLLTPLESMVFDQMTAPNDSALVDTTLDGWIGCRVGRAIRTARVKHKNMAVGLGLDPESFQQVVLSIQTKILAYRKMSVQEQTDFNRKQTLNHGRIRVGWHLQLEWSTTK